MSASGPENRTQSQRLRLLAVLVLAVLLTAVAGAAYVRFTTYTFVVLGDNRPPKVGDPQPEVFARLLEMARDEHPAFVISTGDIVTGSSYQPELVARQYRQLRRLVGPLGTPFHVARGNHDATNPELFDSFTHRPHYYSFSRGGATFWVLDTESEWAPGSIDRDQLAWLKRSLASHRRDRWKFVFMHRSLVTPGADRAPPAHQGFSDLALARELETLFEREHVNIVFGGHVHLFDHQKRGRVDYITTAGAGSPLYAAAKRGGFYHYVVVTVGVFGPRAELVRVSGRREPIEL